jgi:membrane fusion protein, multidrug efflux system
MKKVLPWLGSTLALIVIGGGAYWLGRTQAPAASAAGSAASAPMAPAASKGPSGPPPASVEATRPKSGPLEQGITAVGSLRSDESVIVRPEVSGRIAEILFREGQRVAKGAPMVRFEASVQRAELKQAEANLSLSKSKLDRALDLQKQGFISSQAKDEAENNHRVAQAAFDLASARLTKLEIRAPFAGTVGLRSVSVGDYVRDGQDIANLEAIDPLKVDFRVPELFLKQVASGQNLQVSLDAFPNQAFEGRVLAINPLVDANGRSIVIRAVVKNADSRLRPGMFARVRLLTNVTQEGITIPEQAIVPSGDEFFVFRVVDGRALRTKIEIGQRKAGTVEIVRGVGKDDVVVTAGQLKIRDGVPVKVAEVPAAPSATPAAENKSVAPVPSSPGAAAPTAAPVAKS